MENNIIEIIRKIKRSREPYTWWNNLPVQNLEEPSDSWAAYTTKYFPNRTDCYGLTKRQILHIWYCEQITDKN